MSSIITEFSDIDLYNLPENDSDVWDIICNGDVIGLFQVETFTGKRWCKAAKPRSIEELSDVISILRPGTANCIENGKSLSQHYVDRKHGLDAVPKIHPAIDTILHQTYGVLTYQEQSIQLAKVICGFSDQQAELLRKSMGKKDSKLMAEVKEMFLKGAKEANVVPYELAEHIFEFIQKSEKYSFNKCLAPTTMVETKDGFKTLEEIEIGDEVLCPNKDKPFIKVINKYDNGLKELYRITTQSGKYIECTLDHEFLCEDNEKRPLFLILREGHKILCEDSV